MTAFVLVPAIAGEIEAMPLCLLRGIAEGFEDAEEAAATLRAIFDQFETVARPPQWGQFWSRDTAGDHYVGLVGFKSAPQDGAVEIAYFTFPRFEGRGFASEAIRHLVAHAGRAVDRVIAHTLPEESPSTRALRRCGFACVGDELDPEEGEVWRWERQSGRAGPA
ncbi:MAG TPA: GNAT family N-acetyltransferase [Allosphingosinicella sp.]|nr:GNAT family N-acetyltransferase [Allosphingosinicella sp.]